MAPDDLFELLCINLAICFLPLPLGPEIKTLLFFAATFSIIDLTNKAGEDFPINLTSSSIN